MISVNQKKTAMRETIKKIGQLIQQYLLDTDTKISSLRDETSIHFNTFKKVVNGDPDVRALELLLVIAELMQRDESLDWGITQQFFADLRNLLDDAFDNC